MRKRGKTMEMTSDGISRKIPWYQYLWDSEARKAWKVMRQIKKGDTDDFVDGPMLSNGTAIKMSPEVAAQWEEIPEEIREEMLLAMNEHVNETRMKEGKPNATPPA